MVLTMRCTDATEYSNASYRNATDLHFQVAASYDNFDEIGTGSLASANASDSSVRLFGQTMVTGYSAAESELKKITDSVQAIIPQGSDPAHQALLVVLQKLSGAAFDTTYLRGQLQDHDSSITLYQSELTNGNYISLLQYARKYLVLLQMQRMTADSLLRAIQHP
ncbi:DUF4142 domain-containing protein [Puia dinghuensis]|nr:DUF4142 domain-containing protein [Puia dinghuensis]